MTCAFESSGFRCEEDESFALLSYYAECSGNSLPTLRDNLSVLKRLYEITNTRCVIAQNSTVRHLCIFVYDLLAI